MTQASFPPVEAAGRQAEITAHFAQLFLKVSLVFRPDRFAAAFRTLLRSTSLQGVHRLQCFITRMGCFLSHDLPRQQLHVSLNV